MLGTHPELAAQSFLTVGSGFLFLRKPFRKSRSRYQAD
jgi:hypothetical protein